MKICHSLAEFHGHGFWATHQGAELDLLLFKHGRRVGVECKRMDAPTLTPSMHIALSDLKLDRLLVVYPGPQRYALADRVEVVPLIDLVRSPLEADGVFNKPRSRSKR